MRRVLEIAYVIIVPITISYLLAMAYVALVRPFFF